MCHTLDRLLHSLGRLDNIILVPLHERPDQVLDLPSQFRSLLRCGLVWEAKQPDGCLAFFLVQLHKVWRGFDEDEVHKGRIMLLAVVFPPRNVGRKPNMWGKEGTVPWPF